MSITHCIYRFIFVSFSPIQSNLYSYLTISSFRMFLHKQLFSLSLSPFSPASNFNKYVIATLIFFSHPKTSLSLYPSGCRPRTIFKRLNTIEYQSDIQNQENKSMDDGTSHKTSTIVCHSMNRLLHFQY